MRMLLRREANFDWIARPYRWMEYATFGRALERCRMHFLPQMSGCRRALVFGDGDGRFLARLLAENPQIRVDAVDSSGAMLRLLEQRARAAAPDAAGRLRTFCCDALEFEPEGRYDLIATHFFLDCLGQREVETLARRVAGVAEPGARWVVSEFRVPGGAMHWPARALVRALYAAFRVLTGLRTQRLPDHEGALAAAGFRLSVERGWLGSLLVAQLWEYTPAMQLPPQRPRTPHPPDPVPDPEPPSPSLPQPDPGVFHHETGGPPASDKSKPNE